MHGASANGTTITVVSDASRMEGYPLVANGGTFDFCTDGRISGGNLATFTDQGDSVPDGGTTVGLASLRMRLARQDH